jgi:3-hydroxyisobutyrate dehydrogenase
MTEGRQMMVGFVGLGSQGGPMARRIVEAGFPLLLWARRPEALAPYRDTSAQLVRDLAELGARSDHVGVCVLDDAGVREVVGALLSTMRAGSRIAIHSTIHPDTCIALAKQAAEREVAVIDAPVSGGGHGAAAGTLTVMVGGDVAAVDAARPVFETFSGLISHLGGVGAGQFAKLVNNSLMAANMALADAALGAGAACWRRSAFASTGAGRFRRFSRARRAVAPGGSGAIKSLTPASRRIRNERASRRSDTGASCYSGWSGRESRSG